MNKKPTICVAAFTAFTAGAVLPLYAAELAHRWSFNGDYADSVGGAKVATGFHIMIRRTAATNPSELRDIRDNPVCPSHF